ncbi:MAG: anti-sigma factor antagonist [Chloroflexi bacterium AL-N10]|nr:anti-sigma factor antagonist [Chloroflexi bacterium AL-N10]NOK92771.1 anti-sigma factor antagonist [Chloroflexi bacterium AL-N15]
MSKSVEIIKLSGIIDGTTSRNLRDEVDNLLDNKPDYILLDFQDVTFMNSSGLGALVSIFKKVRAENADLHLCSLNEQVEMIFSLTTMDNVFTIHKNQADFNKSIQ